MAANSFPSFSDGNVEIRFSEKDKFVLHSWQLALHSPWFKAALSERWTNATNTAAPGGKHYWIYELRFDKDSAVGTLVRSPSGAPGDAATSKTTELLDNCDLWDDKSDNGQDVPGDYCSPIKEQRIIIAKAQQDLFRCLYHVSPEFDHAEVFVDDGLFAMEAPTVQLYEAAKMYGCEAVVRLAIVSRLRDIEMDIVDECHSDPVSMLKFSMTLKSEWIFKEAARHLVGRSNRFFDQSRNALHELAIYNIIADARKIFVQDLKDAEAEMFCIQLSPVESTFLGMAALSFFRHWLSEQLHAKKGSGLCPDYANLYHTINKGMSMYKTAAQKQFIRSFMNKICPGFTDDNMRDVEPELKKIFKKAAVAVKPLLVQHTRYKDDTEDNYRALTCLLPFAVKVPWEKKD